MDIKLFRFINLLSGRFIFLDKLMIFISTKMKFVFFIILVVLLFKKKNITLEAVVSILISLFMHFIIKVFYFKPRPFLERRVGILLPSKVDSSFPSKHTLLVFAVSTIVFIYQRILGSIMFGFSILTGVSRIWLGHHYPSDIAGSAVLGTFTSSFIHKFVKRK
ncbi:phosphatase PAP2 family protein [Neobacillus cucumis]|uniref:Undecaprenyl-diphosphatase n=1 Tax=Neobacillus cucumis TaxID=1740721 RepID=A0A2N5HNH4_9BACI|nr:phosphatase PAP2 family protein [Neobacillus cucumis]PLS07076.1 undecaprenyl-diphosphatase [Neobacillus cucumis]